MGNELDDLFEEEGLVQRTGVTCPSCLQEMKPGAILCVQCGYNTRTGEKLQSHKTEAERTMLGHTLLDKAAAEMEHDQKLQSKLQGAGLPWWALLLMLIGIIALAIVMIQASLMIGSSPDSDARVVDLPMQIIG